MPFCSARAQVSPWAIGFVLAGLFVAWISPADLRADTTLNSGTTTVHSGTNFGGKLYVATTGIATLNVTGGMATSGTGWLGSSPGGNGTVMVSSGTWANSGDIIIGDKGTGSLKVTGGRVISTNGILGNSSNGTGTATVSSGTWANSGNLTVGDKGTGTLTISGGLVTVGGTLSRGTSGTINLNSGGTLQIGTGTTGGVLGVTTLTNNGTLIFNRSDAYTYSGIISGTGAITKQGAGTLTLTGTSAWPNAIVMDRTLNVQAGTLAILASGAGNLYVGNSGTGTLNVIGGSVTNTTGWLGYDAGSVGTATVSSGTWANSRNLTVGVSGTGTLTMSGGLVTVGGTLSRGSFGTINLNSGGTLQIGTGTTDGVLSVSTLTNNGTLVFNRSNASTYSGIISGTGAITKQGAGILTLNGGNSYSGLTTISGGTLALSGSGSIGTGGLWIGGSGTATLNVIGGSVTNTTGWLGYDAGSVGTATVSSGTWANSRNLTVGGSGTGTLTMSGGLVTVGGTLSKGTFGTINLNSGGMLQIGTGTTDGVLGVSALANNGTLVFNRSDASTYSGIISGTGSVSKQGAGALTLSGNNTFSGVTTITTGSLSIGAGGTAGSIAGNVVDNGTLVFNRSDASTYSGIISGTGSVTKQGGGTLTLTAHNSYSGLTTISGGTLALSGSGSIGTGGLNLGNNGVFDISSVTSGTSWLPVTGDLEGPGTLRGRSHTLAVLGSFMPGNSVGIVTVDAGLTLDLSGAKSTTFEITSPSFTAGTYDLVNGNGSVIFGGSFNLVFSGGSFANGTNVLKLFTNTGALAGHFTEVNSTGLAAGQHVTFSDATGYISISAIPEPSTYALAAIGAGIVGLMHWRKRRTAKIAAKATA